jgi:hypothetical protein
MNRYVICVNMSIVVDSESEPEELCDDLYARLSELVQSEEHMLKAEIEYYNMPGNNMPAEVTA